MAVNSMDKKMGTKSMFKLTMVMSLPAIFSMLVQALYNIVNCYDYFGGKHLDKVVVNCFSQNEDFTTNYEQLKLIVKELKKQIKTDCKLWLENHIITIGIPKNYGCGIAKGNWETVKKIWCNAFKNEDKLELQIWEF